jgi:predicted DsbA family dithiol-disulfide isomerase
LKQNYDIAVNYVYFPLHPDTPDEGQSLQDLFGPGANISGMIGRLKMLMDEEGLPFDGGRHMTFNSRLAQELAKWGESKPQSDQLNMALYQAYFVDGQNIGDKEVLLRVVEQVGLPLEEAREVLEQRLKETAVDADWRRALGIGVSSVPTFAVGLKGVAGAQPYEQLTLLLEHSGASKRA